MEAYIVEEPGGDFRKTDLPRPTLRPNHVLVRIKASGVNPLDTKIRAGKASHAKQSLPAVLGVDMAGTVEEIRPDVTAFSLGWGTHSLAPLSMRCATFSGVFTLLPLITGEGHAHHGEILAHITALVEGGELKPLLNDHVIPMVDVNTARTR